MRLERGQGKAKPTAGQGTCNGTRETAEPLNQGLPHVVVMKTHKACVTEYVLLSDYHFRDFT